MGLDQYLNRKRESKLEHIEWIRGELLFRSTTIDEGIGYWRKFNPLHNYIVQEFGGGVDECQEIALDKQDLAKIVEVLKAVQACETVEGKLEMFPLARGFFFGVYALEDEDDVEWFNEYVDYSIEVFELALATLENEERDPDWYGWEVFYQASW